MAVIEQNSMPFKPYARLMNILGDQLITNKIVAVIEILKNCYDADSPSAEIRFCNLSNINFNDLPKEDQAYIEIKDFGYGMSLSTIENVWLRPATPEKLDKKRQNRITPKGRVIQGEKGIGRFAIHKLGGRIEVYTKTINEREIKLEMDFSKFDPDPDERNLFNQNQEHKLLEDVKNTWYINDPAEEITYESGTIIRIYNPREPWSKEDLKILYKNIQRLIPPFDANAANLGIEFKKDFDINMYVDDKVFTADEVMTFEDVIERAQFKMIGKVNEFGILNFTYKSNTPQRTFDNTINILDKNDLSTNGYSIRGTKRFIDETTNHTPKCGPFAFTFYAFDLKKPDKTILNNELKEFIKENFVYVLRDGVRVYPYGEKELDWLNLDKLRSTYKAGQFISYNDLTGFIYISQEHNPLLKDASNRQGIVNTNGAYEDFTNLVTAVTEIFNAEIKIDKLKSEIHQKKNFDQTKSKLSSSFDNLKQALEKIKDTNVLDAANKFIDTYTSHLKIVEDRMKTVEDLAGLGMAVEKSSHDALRLLMIMKSNIKDIIYRIKKDAYIKEDLISLLTDLDENLTLVYDDMQMIQPLFKIQRTAIKDVSVLDCIKKVLRYFRYEIDDKIKTNINEIEEDLVVSTNTGLILQILINLIDNAIYWLNASDERDKKLYFEINPIEKTIIVADNGNGIRSDIAPLVFNEFVSMKTNGRGLGLYIVRELLFRINAEVYILENDKDKILPGANFIIKFNKTEE